MSTGFVGYGHWTPSLTRVSRGLLCKPLAERGGPLICSDLAEIAVCCFADDLRRIIHLLGALDSVGGHSAAQWGELKVLGGDHAAQAERRAELLEELEAVPPKLLRLARKIRGNPPDSQRGRYIAGLLRGLSGEDLRGAAGLSDRKMEACRKWLRSIMVGCREEPKLD